MLTSEEGNSEVSTSCRVLSRCAIQGQMEVEEKSDSQVLTAPSPPSDEVAQRNSKLYSNYDYPEITGV